MTEPEPKLDIEATLNVLIDSMTNLNARLSAQRFLLEVVYANQFLDNEDGFTELMDGLMHLTRTAPTKNGPIPPEDAIELQARIATELQRFQNSVNRRIAQGVNPGG